MIRWWRIMSATASDSGEDHKKTNINNDHPHNNNLAKRERDRDNTIKEITYEELINLEKENHTTTELEATIGKSNTTHYNEEAIEEGTTNLDPHSEELNTHKEPNQENEINRIGVTEKRTQTTTNTMITYEELCNSFREQDNREDEITTKEGREKITETESTEEGVVDEAENRDPETETINVGLIQPRI